ncbi:hypothetical protein L1987_76080 [Smallanthus sonchifolius]|uniref:Uncharacterized protein n=1 Tax=Smallanthus sonchifolius TaxID=185202 RepID=A0ACB9A8H7_9ASTR|nr:hypothetical protein L1987_76080 [Smallanthus sonchifolius]
MPLETWLIKVKKTISQTFDSVRTTPPTKTSTINKSRIRVLAFEVAGIMQKLTHMWRLLSDENIAHLQHQSTCLEGVCKIVSSKDAFLLALARAEMVENIRVLVKSVSHLSIRCEDSNLRRFETAFEVFANTHHESDHDPYGWVLNSKDIQTAIKKMERYVAATATLYNSQMDHQELTNTIKQQKILDHQQINLHWQRQEVKYLKQKSLWNTSFDEVTSLLATTIFTLVSRIKLVFGTKSSDIEENYNGFFETNSKTLKPASNTLGYAGLSLHYANLIIVMEKMIRSPKLVGVDARDDLYSMLPNSIRSTLRGRLKGIGFTASDPVLAGEWRNALGMILGWLSPLAHNMIKWQNERSFEHQNLVPKTNNKIGKSFPFHMRLDAIGV